MEVEDIASICHEAVRRYQSVTREQPYPYRGLPLETWEASSDLVKQAATQGVVMIMNAPDKDLGFHHNNWLENKQKAGWKYGEKLDLENKEHPFIAPYQELPLYRRQEDALFKAIVLALTQGEKNV